MPTRPGRALPRGYALSELSLADRSEILSRLVQLEAAEDQQGVPASEKDLLDQELDDYRGNPEPGSPWNVAEARLRRKQ